MEFFKPLNVFIDGIGATFKSSKKQFVWKFELDEENHQVELECSFLTNKRRVFFDKELKFKGYKPFGEAFSHRFFYNKHIITVENNGTDADIIIDNYSFNEIYGRKIWERMYGRAKPAPSASKQEEGSQLSKLWKEELAQAKPARPISGNLEAPQHDLLQVDSKKELEEDFLELGPEIQDSDFLELSDKEDQKNQDLLDFGSQSVFEVPKVENKRSGVNLDWMAFNEEQPQQKDNTFDLLFS